MAVSCADAVRQTEIWNDAEMQKVKLQQQRRAADEFDIERERSADEGGTVEPAQRDEEAQHDRQWHGCDAEEDRHAGRSQHVR